MGKWPFKCPPPPDLTCRLPIGWITSQEGPAILARGIEKWEHLKQAMQPVKPTVLKDGQDGSVMRWLGNQERKRGPGNGCTICCFDCESVFVPRSSE